MNRHIILLLFGLLLMAWTNAVPAADAPAAGAAAPPPRVGVLTARGTGSIGGFMTMGYVAVTLEGDLRVPASARVKITGEPGTKTAVTNRAGTLIGYQYTHFHGKAVISLATGEQHNFNYIIVQGKDIDILMAGIGQARLTGEGTYTLARIGADDISEGTWTSPPAANGTPVKTDPLVIGDFVAPGAATK